MKGRLLVLVLLFGVSLVKAQVRMPHVFSDHMVLQRDVAIPFWGWGSPGDTLRIEMAGRSIETIVDDNGQWEACLPVMKAGGPYQVLVTEKGLVTSSLRFEDLMIGDVWLASGQSNMEWQVQQSDGAKEAIAQAYDNNIRFFNVPHAVGLSPLNDIQESSWAVCDSLSLKEASAVAYYFAKNIQPEAGVVIGILQSTWGGTPVEAWTSRDMLASTAEGRKGLEASDTLTMSHLRQDTVDLDLFWDIVYNPDSHIVLQLADPDYKDKDWREVPVPGVISDWESEFYEGMIWMRKRVSLDKSFQSKDLTVDLGRPEMNYSLFFNGVEICKNIWNATLKHQYTIPAHLVRKGDNVIAIRLAALWGGGGLKQSAEVIGLSNGSQTLSLAGEWRYKKDLERPIPKVHYYHQNSALIYNAMISPVVPYALKGFLWYQGENNEGEAYAYRKLLPLMVTDWRIRWRQGNLPFLLVQLPNYMSAKTEPVDEEWAVLRESQAMTLQLPQTAMVCIIDCGEEGDIHPKNKTVVGERLARMAAEKVYGLDVQASGPVLDRYAIEGSKVRIWFANASGDLTTVDKEPVTGFAIAGEDQQFYWAEARIEKGSIVLSSDKVKAPVAVRYAWANNPKVNLVNKDGLPAVPFRTDQWKVVTEP